jgi:hypothetical protein
VYLARFWLVCSPIVYATLVLNKGPSPLLSTFFRALPLDEYCMRDNRTTSIRFCIVCIWMG